VATHSIRSGATFFVNRGLMLARGWQAALKLQLKPKMKATKLLTLGVLIGTCSFAAAQDPAAPPPPPPAEAGKPPRGDRPQREIPPALLKKYDKDADGKLSPEERKTMQDERKAEMLKKYDKDGDGKLSEEENKTMREDQQAKRKALLEKYDANKNGKLDPEETKAAADAGEEIPMGGRGPGGGGGGKRGGDKPTETPPGE
jgi:EF hand